MGSFVRDKNEKVKQVFQILGSDHTEEDFINTFKRLYPEDWQKIQDLWSYCNLRTPSDGFAEQNGRDAERAD